MQKIILAIIIALSFSGCAAQQQQCFGMMQTFSDGVISVFNSCTGEISFVDYRQNYIDFYEKTGKEPEMPKGNIQ